MGASPLAVHSWGPPGGTPVLVVHGVRNTGLRFRRLAEEGLPGRRVTAPDLRGHGASTWLPPWDPGTHVADLVAVLDAWGVASAHVVGHSFGGLLALQLAAEHPRRVASVALLDPAVALAAERCADAAAADLAGEGRAGSWATLEEVRAAWLEGRPPQGRWAVDEDIAAFVARGDDGRLRYRFSRAAAVAAWSAMAAPPPRLTAYGGPVLLVPAALDDFVTPALREALARDVGTRLTERPVRCGHMMFWDAHDELAAILADFIGP